VDGSHAWSHETPPVVTRLVLLVVLALCVWVYFPETRSMLIEAASPLIDPVRKWSAEEQMAQIARNVVEHERLTGEMPEGGAWLPWLEYRYSNPDMRRDPWGAHYQLDPREDSVAILSVGPDGLRGTEDDFEVLSARRR
jgi:hypothetical protein